MRTVRPVLAAAALLALPAAAAPAVAAEPRTERLVVAMEAVEKGPSSLPAGTVRISHGPVRDVPSGRRIGHWAQVCIATGRRDDQCEGTVVLPAGRIMVSGTWHRSAGPGHMAVTGGTGRYRGVRGDLTEDDVPGLDHDVFRLTR